MIDTEAFINQLYWFLKENRYIDKTPNAAREEMFLFQKLEKTQNSGSLSQDDYNNLTTLCYNALYENEISGFIAGIYLSKIINSLI